MDRFYRRGGSRDYLHYLFTIGRRKVSDTCSWYMPRHEELTEIEYRRLVGLILREEGNKHSVISRFSDELTDLLDEFLVEQKIEHKFKMSDLIVEKTMEAYKSEINELFKEKEFAMLALNEQMNQQYQDGGVYDERGVSCGVQ
jgi:hypothetical protein